MQDFLSDASWFNSILIFRIETFNVLCLNICCQVCEFINYLSMLLNTILCCHGQIALYKVSFALCLVLLFGAAVVNEYG